MAQVQAPDAVAQAVVSHWPETVASDQAERAAAMVIGPGLGNDSQRLAEAEALLQQLPARCIHLGRVFLGLEIEQRM